MPVLCQRRRIEPKLISLDLHRVWYLICAGFPVFIPEGHIDTTVPEVREEVRIYLCVGEPIFLVVEPVPQKGSLGSRKRVVVSGRSDRNSIPVVSSRRVSIIVDISRPYRRGILSNKRIEIAERDLIAQEGTAGIASKCCPLRHSARRQSLSHSQSG